MPKPFRAASACPSNEDLATKTPLRSFCSAAALSFQDGGGQLRGCRLNQWFMARAKPFKTLGQQFGGRAGGAAELIRCARNDGGPLIHRLGPKKNPPARGRRIKVRVLYV